MARHCNLPYYLRGDQSFPMATKVHIDPKQNVVPIAAAVAQTNAVPFARAASRRKVHYDTTVFAR